MSAAPAVSIVVIYRDAEAFLREAIASVAAQDFADWELILVDDGSRDGGGDIAREFAVRDMRISCHCHPQGVNRGMSASRRLGVSHAKAPVLAFLDADDVWVPSKLREQTAVLRKHPQAELVFGQTRFWFGWTGRQEDMARDFVWRMDAPTGTCHSPPSMLRHAPLGNCLKPSMSNFMARRACLDRIGAFEDDFPGLHEDHVFWIKVFANVVTHHAEACWDWCRHHASSHSSRPLEPAAARAQWLRYHRWVVDYFDCHPVADPYVAHLVEEFRIKVEHPDSYARSARYHYHGMARRVHRALACGVRAELRGRIARRRRGTW